MESTRQDYPKCLTKTLASEALMINSHIRESNSSWREDEQQRLSSSGAEQQRSRAAVETEQQRRRATKAEQQRKQSIGGYGGNTATAVAESADLLRKGRECRFAATESRRLRGKGEEREGFAPPFTASQIISLAKDSSHGSNPLPVLAAKLPHRLDNFRTFINARVKWLPNPFLDDVPCPSHPLPVKVSPQALTLRKEESAIHGLPAQLDDVVRRLAKLLMLTSARKSPFYVVNVEM
ncbi:hypothetical protein WN944_003344 [Citrus x changshan-huyou]|uniref:PORR domain-containing protein n=1 Tax=Citrus x changshan-huyou TaxID=2935761 RepID=A0AAP0LZS0_9ROSI